MVLQYDITDTGYWREGGRQIVLYTLYSLRVTFLTLFIGHKEKRKWIMHKHPVTLDYNPWTEHNNSTPAQACYSTVIIVTSSYLSLTLRPGECVVSSVTSNWLQSWCLPPTTGLTPQHGVASLLHTTATALNCHNNILNVSTATRLHYCHDSLHQHQ